jgi:hypothetical protein
MNWDAVSAIAESVGVVGVIVSLIYLAIQLKENTNIARSQSRQSITEFVQKFAEIRTTHADRMAKLQSSTDLTDADREFLTWIHCQILLLGEMYHYNFQLGLMPESHWRPFVEFFKGYSTTLGFRDAWQVFEGNFAEEFQDWVQKEILHPESDGKIVG